MLEWVEGRNNLYVPKQDGTLLCSTIDPVQEGKRWVERQLEELKGYDVYFILGLAGGFHVSSLASKFPDSEIIVIEPNKHLEEQLLSRRGPLNENVTVLAGLSPDELKRNVYFRSGLKSLFRLLVYPTSLRLNKSYYDSIEKLLLGRDVESFFYHLEGRKELKRFFETLNLKEKTKALTVLDIESAIQNRKMELEKEAVIFLALRELVK